MDPEQEFEVPNSKSATANLLIKFEGDRSPSYLKIVELKSIKPRAQTSEDAGMVPFLVVECRGLEPVGWRPTGPYCVTSEGGTLYDEVSFRDGDDWNEYDEKSEMPMSVEKDIKYEWALHREK